MTSTTRDLRQALGMAALAALALAGSLPLARAANHQGSSIMTMKQDLADREKDIHWPEGFNPSQADLFSHNALLINASCQRIWGHIVDATKWPQWYPHSKDVRIDGGDVLKEGTVFHWSTFGLPLESKVNEFVPYTRIGWYGYAPGTAPSFYHTWYVKPQGDTCLVVTDEVGKGNDAAHLRETDESRWILHEGRRRLHPYPHAGPRGTRSIYHAVARLRGGAHCGAARLEGIGGQSLRYQPRDNAFHQSPPATRVGFAM